MAKKKDEQSEDMKKEKKTAACGETQGAESAAGAKAADTPAADKAAAPEAAKTPAGPAPEELLAAEKDRYLRLLAEYDNYRKRTQKERDGLYDDVLCSTVLKLLPVYDNLSRALKQDTEDTAFYKGVEMTMQQMEEILKKLGVTEIDAVGKKFDPALHNAVMHIEDKNYGENEIVDEFEKGFRLGDRVIRFSMVRVAN